MLAVRSISASCASVRQCSPYSLSLFQGSRQGPSKPSCDTPVSRGNGLLSGITTPRHSILLILHSDGRVIEAISDVNPGLTLGTTRLTVQPHISSTSPYHP